MVGSESHSCDVPLEPAPQLEALEAPRDAKYFYQSEPDCMAHTYQDFSVDADGAISVQSGGEGVRYNHTQACVERFEK